MFEEYRPKHYILTKTLQRKNARRRIVDRFYTKQACIDYAVQHYEPNVNYQIYSYNWTLIEDIDIMKLVKKERKEERTNEIIYR